ncbi:MAG: translation elongation factor EF-1 subunit alpha [Candidatus Aenigmarchaeota archaeon]|nr:translation elongation factor EF-1 subunit alpha [Candidatus Aenigmarchaeota archaeon]
MPVKPHMNMVTIGHVDHGKSTIVGRLLFESGVVREEELKQLQKLAMEYKITGAEYAFLLDREKEERIRGMTIDIMHRPFETSKYFFTIIDCPGHRDFVKNMITGASQADVALLVVSARPGEGVQEQTKEHAYLARVLGIQQLVVVITKMDMSNWDQKRFDELKNGTIELLKPLGFNVEKIPFIPVSGQLGDNLLKRSANMPWYTGPTLVEILDALEIPKRPTEKPLRLPVQDVYTITGVGTVPVGRVETGVLKTGDTVVFEPSGVKGEVKSIEIHHQTIPEANPGDNVGFNIRGVSKAEIKRGDVAGHPNNPPTVAKEFTGQIIVLQHPTVITVGYTPVFHCHTASIACRIEEIIAKIDPRTGAVIQEHPDFLKNGEAARVRIVPTRPMVIEKQADFPELARFAIRDMGITVAAGVCLDIVKAK